MIRRTVPTEEGDKYWFDSEAADAGVAFFRERLTFTVGEWAGERFEPSADQEQIIRDLFGWKRTDDGTRRYRVAFIWVPRKAGKSEFAAGLALLLLLGDDEPGAEIYCLATNDDQARIVYDRAVSMVVNDEELSQALKPFKSLIWYGDTASKIEPLTGKPRGKHGLVAQGVIADECHEWVDDDLYVFVHQSEGNRRQPLDIFTSTAGKKEGPGYEYFKLCEAILDGKIIAPSTYVYISQADPEKHKTDTLYWTTPEAWAEANPHYPRTPKHSYLEDECARAQGNPRLENNFLRYHLNLWVEQDTRWLNMTRWDACAHSDWHTMAERMKGRKCVKGIDLSAVRDLTADILVFPPDEDDPLWRILPRLYIPSARLDERVKLDKQPFDKWLRDGAIVATPGDVVDQQALKDQIYKDAETYDVQGVMIDRWNATQFAVDLQAEGLNAQLFGQGYGSLSGPSKWLERAVLLKALDHGGHPVLRWCASNVAIQEDAAGNIKPAKDKSTDRIDGIVALIMGIGGCDEHLTEPSVYEKRGVLTHE